MLVSLLPGLRDLRTPLATGYLWFILLWLVLKDQIPRSFDEAEIPLKALYELGALVGRPAVLGAISFCAYLCGSMLVPDLSRTHLFTGPIRTKRVFLITMHERLHHHLDPGVKFDAFTTLIRHLELSAADSDTPKAGQEYQRIFPSRLRTEPYAGLAQAIIKDLPSVAIRLQAKDPRLWDTYDRRTSEANFRYGVFLPLFAIIVVVTMQADRMLWAFLLALPVSLLIQGLRQSSAASNTLVQALALGIVTAPIMDQARQLVEGKTSHLSTDNSIDSDSRSGMLASD